MRRVLLCWGCFLLIPFATLAQVTPYSDDPDEFFGQLGEHFKSINDKETKELTAQFAEKWTTEAIGYDEQEKMMKTFIKLQKLRYKFNPDFEQYVIVMNEIYNDEYASELFFEWDSIINTLAASKRKAQMRSFNKGLLSFLRSKAIFEVTGKTWSVTSEDFKLIMDKKTPLIQISNTDLTCTTKRDSLTIKNTSGSFYPTTNKWKGNGGTVDWEKVGLPSTDVYAELATYTVDLRRTDYQADSVMFLNREMFDYPIEGRLTDRVSASEDAPFPKFISKGNTFKLDVEDYISYLGGFGMAGKKIIGASTDEPCILTIRQNGKVAFKGESFNFLIEENRVLAQKCASTIYLDKDSILHPQLMLSINRENKHVELTGSNNGIGSSPFFNSLHKVEMYVNKVDWYLDSSFIDLSKANDPDGLALFESSNFFSDVRYKNVQGMMNTHPLERIYRFSQTHKRSLYNYEEFAAFMGGSPEGLKALTIILNNQGFLYYNIDDQTVKIQRKLKNYVLAHKKLIDFDVLMLPSVSRNLANARLDLGSKELSIRGVKQVQLSDSQNVVIYPRNQTITLKANRDMEYDGVTLAGRFEFFGENFSFRYNEFDITLEKVDSLRFSFPDEKRGGQLRRVQTVLQDVTGTLYIDKPKNKSGRVSYGQYPIFDCSKGAYVYYDYKTVYNGVYKRKNFYFAVDPFNADSLDNFKMAGLELNGTFNSGRILPEFKERLRLQPDFSLGFETRTPDAGYPLYGGKGICKMEIKLSNRGLQGAGFVNYNESSLESYNMTFFPDSMEGRSSTFLIKDHSSMRYPNVKTDGAFAEWLPFDDTLKVTTIREKSIIDMYDSAATLKGQIRFTPKKLYGGGELKYKEGIANSEYYAFERRKLGADSADFRIMSKTKKDIPAFTNANARIKIDFDKEILEGANNHDSILSHLPINQYSTNIPRFSWVPNEDELKLQKDPRMPDEDFFFVSTNPIYDSLSFSPNEAIIDLSINEIEAFNIRYIEVADALIYPDTSIRIGEEGKIPLLKNAKIDATDENRYHQIVDASVNIMSSKKYTGFGTYLYADGRGSEERFPMHEIRVDEEGQTFGNGSIPDSLDFFFGPLMKYSGGVSFEANERGLYFDGLLELQHAFREPLATENVVYKGRVAADSLFITLDRPTNKDAQSLYTGVYMNTITNELYALFLGQKKNKNDWPVIENEGILYYDEDSSQLIISNAERLDGDDYAGDVWYLDLQKKFVRYQGNMSFGMEFTDLDIGAYGYAVHDLEKGSFDFELSCGLTFPIDAGAIKMMADSVDAYAYFNSSVVNSRSFVVSGVLQQLEDEKEKTKAIETIESEEVIPTFKTWEPTLMVSQMKMKWDTASSSFLSQGQIGIANFGGTPINKKLNGRFEFVKNAILDSTVFYLEGNIGNWYCFSFSEGILYYNSSDGLFDQKVKERKPKSTKGRYVMEEYEAVLVDWIRKQVARKEE